MLDKSSLPGLTVGSVKVTRVVVPMRFPLGTSVATVREAPLVLVDLTTPEGITGHAYVFGYRRAGSLAIEAIIREAADLVSGDRAIPVDIAAKLARRYGLLGVTGAVRMALSALDMALWDALAKAAECPLATLLGRAPRALWAYNSCGLGLMSPEAAADEAERLVAGGFQGVKLRLGHPSLAEDIAVTRAVRNTLSTTISLMVDFNQALSVPEALARGHALGAEGVKWIEEPIRHDDYAGNARLAADVSLPIQLGENFNGVPAMAAALDAGACDLVMPDVARIGGVTGWLQAADLAESREIGMSSHLMPEISAQLLCATPTADWLEYVDWADPILAEPLVVTEGFVMPSTRPGTGIAWNPDGVARYRVA